MNGRRFKAPIAGAAMLVLCMPILISKASGNTPRIPSKAVTPVRSDRQKITSIDDVLAGIKLTDDQKSKIEQIRSNYRNKMDIIAKDSRSDAGQKAAMLDGYQRIERREIFHTLTPDQLAEVRKKVLAERATNQAGAGQRHQPTLNQPGAGPNVRTLDRPK